MISCSFKFVAKKSKNASYEILHDKFKFTLEANHYLLNTGDIVEISRQVIGGDYQRMQKPRGIFRRTRRSTFSLKVAS